MEQVNVELLVELFNSMIFRSEGLKFFHLYQEPDQYITYIRAMNECCMAAIYHLHDTPYIRTNDSTILVSDLMENLSLYVVECQRHNQPWLQLHYSAIQAMQDLLTEMRDTLLNHGMTVLDTRIQSFVALAAVTAVVAAMAALNVSMGNPPAIGI